MKKLIIVLLACLLLWGILHAAVTTGFGTYSSKKQLGDQLFYTFTFTNTNAGDSYWFGGRDGDGFLVSNMNDNPITIDIVSDGTAADVDWYVDVLGNHEATSTDADTTTKWVYLTTKETNSMIDAKQNAITFSLDSLGKHPYLFIRLKGVNGANEAGQAVTVRIIFDFDDKYVGKE